MKVTVDEAIAKLLEFKKAGGKNVFIANNQHPTAKLEPVSHGVRIVEQSSKETIIFRENEVLSSLETVSKIEDITTILFGKL